MLFLCFSDARLDLSDEDAAVALALTECSARSYAELVKSDVPSSSGLKSAKSSTLRPSPPSTLGVFSFGLAVAAPTRGEILVHLEGISRKPRSVKGEKQILLRGISRPMPRFRNWRRLQVSLSKGQSGPRRP